MSANSDPLLHLKVKLDELERVVLKRFEPKVIERPVTWTERAPVRDLPAQETSREAPGALRALIARFFGSRA